MDKFSTVTRKVEGLPALERKAVRRALHRAKGRTQRRLVADVVTDMVTARCRVAGKRRSDAQTDARRRTLVGARVRREDARRYREAATGTGRSLYRFTVDALEREVERSFDG